MGTRSSKISVYSDSDQSDITNYEYLQNDNLQIETNNDSHIEKNNDTHIIQNNDALILLKQLVLKYRDNWGNFSMLYHIVKNIAKLDESTSLPILNYIVPCFLKDNILNDVLVYHHASGIEKDMKFAKKYPNVYAPYTLKRLKKQINQSMYMYNYCFVTHSKLTDYSNSLRNYLISVVTELIVLIQTFKKYLYDNKLIDDNEYKGIYMNLPIKYIDCRIDVERIIKSAELGSYDSNKVYILYS